MGLSCSLQVEFLIFFRPTVLGVVDINWQVDYVSINKHLVSCILHRLQRQQTCLSCFQAVFKSRLQSYSQSLKQCKRSPGQIKQLGNPLLGVCLKGENYVIALSPCRKSCIDFLTKAEVYTSPLDILVCL